MAFPSESFKDGEITEAFELPRTRPTHGRLSDPRRVRLLRAGIEATIENIEDAAWRLKNEFDLPEGWESEVYSWLSDNDSSEVENTDDLGGYPSEESLRAAFVALGYPRTA